MALQHRRTQVLGRLTELDPRLTESAAEELLDLAARHQLRWEAEPERVVFGGEIRQIGFLVGLIGEHFHPSRTPSPGCDECVRVYFALRKIATWSLPRGEHASYYEVQPFDHAMRFTKEGVVYVRVVVKILHRSRFEAPPDACQRACLAEIEAKLSALGVRAIERQLGHG